MTNSFSGKNSNKSKEELGTATNSKLKNTEAETPNYEKNNDDDYYFESALKGEQQERPERRRPRRWQQKEKEEEAEGIL